MQCLVAHAALGTRFGSLYTWSHVCRSDLSFIVVATFAPYTKSAVLYSAITALHLPNFFLTKSGLRSETPVISLTHLRTLNLLRPSLQHEQPRQLLHDGFLSPQASTSRSTPAHTPLQPPPPQNRQYNPPSRTHRLQLPRLTRLRRRRAPRRPTPTPTSPVNPRRRIVLTRLRPLARQRAARRGCVTGWRRVG